MNKAVILVAGIGSRLRPITNEKPKTLVEVNGKPILGYIIDTLLESDINDITLLCGFHAEKIKRYCTSSFPKIKFTYIENKEFDTTNNLYSLFLARDALTDDVLIMNGDLVFDSSVIKSLVALDETSVAVDVGKYMEESMKVTVENGLITGISKKITPENSYGCSIDVYRFIKKDAMVLAEELTRTVESGNLTEWTEAAFDRLFQSGQIEAAICPIGDARWFEIDTIDDLIDAELKFNSNLSRLKETQIFFLDNDGTLTLSDNVIPGVTEALSKLRETRTIFILTNNSSKTPADIVEKFEHILPIKESEILVSTQSAMDFFKEKGFRNIFVVANKKTSSYLEDNGFTLVEKNPQAVLLCYDDEITYEKIVKIVRFIDAGVPYYATHLDAVCPTSKGFVPDIGAFIKMIADTIHQNPLRIFGKPSPEFITPLLSRLGVPASQAVVVGDRMYTDIQLGKVSGSLSVLVFSGETSRADYEESELKADIAVRNISDLIPYL